MVHQHSQIKKIEFVCNLIDFNFIPAIRTERDAIKVIDSLIEKELATLEESSKYTEAISIVEKLQQDILDNIATQIAIPLKTFIPSVNRVQFLPKEQRRKEFRRNIEVVIDDGTLTPIQLKGNGIKSLIALAMLNITNQSGRMSIVAIEEPESHLHPEGARQLYKTILSLSENHQVILTTHSPLFINRLDLQENIIVNAGKAVLVKKIKEIRNILGTIVSDNLINAENILVVEGEDDKIAFAKMLPYMSEKIKYAIQNGTLVIDYLAGAGNLSQKLVFYKTIQCSYHILLDNDDAGRKAGERAETHGLAVAKNITYIFCNGSPNAELEYCYNLSAYEQALSDEFGLDLKVFEFRGNKKWSERIANCFMSQGMQWSESTEKKVKLTVTNTVPANPDETLNPHKNSAIIALVKALERMLV